MTTATHIPPQQKHAPPRTRAISATIHITGLLFSIASFAWLPNITNPLHKGFGGSYQFLTIIALTLSALTFVVSLLVDISPTTFSQFLAAVVKDFLSVCATPLEVLVATFYWTLYAIDKNLVQPPGHPLPFIPNLGLHAVPAIMLTLDMLASPLWSIKFSGVVKLDVAFFFLYWAWLEFCFSFNGWYPYPGLIQNSIWQKLIFCLFSAGVMAGITMVLKWVHGRINGDDGFRRVVFDPVEKIY